MTVVQSPIIITFNGIEYAVEQSFLRYIKDKNTRVFELDEIKGNDGMSYSLVEDINDQNFIIDNKYMIKFTTKYCIDFDHVYYTPIFWERFRNTLINFSGDIVSMRLIGDILRNSIYIHQNYKFANDGASDRIHINNPSPSNYGAKSKLMKVLVNDIYDNKEQIISEFPLINQIIDLELLKSVNYPKSYSITSVINDYNSPPESTKSTNEIMSDDTSSSSDSDTPVITKRVVKKVARR